MPGWARDAGQGRGFPSPKPTLFERTPILTVAAQTGSAMTEPPNRCPVCDAEATLGAARCPACGARALITVHALHEDGAKLDETLVREQAAEFRRRLTDDPGDALARRAHAIALANLGKIDQADRELALAIDAEPNNPLLLAERASLLADLATAGRRGAERDAWRHLDRALALQPDLPEALLLKTRLLLARNELRDALDAARSVLARGGGKNAPIVADMLVAHAQALASRDEWLDAFRVWREAAAIAPDRARPAILETLREEQDVLLSPPRWSWLVYPPVSDRQRAFQYAAAVFVAAVACLAFSVLIAANDEWLLLSVVPLLGTVAAPVATLLFGRRRLRRRAAPHWDLVARIRAKPAALFRGDPPLETMLAALEYVATERQGEAMARQNPWLLGRGSAIDRRARRGALLRAPWLPAGRDDADQHR